MLCCVVCLPVAIVAPYAINTPWWDEPARGGNKHGKSAAQKAEMLLPEDVANSVDMIIQQPIQSDIERVVIEPHKPYTPPAPKSSPAAAAAAAAQK